jgi:hypothetical protein
MKSGTSSSFLLALFLLPWLLLKPDEPVASVGLVA